MTYNCAKCEGKGKIAAFSKVLGGVCFKCNGAGKVAKKPAAASSDWACAYDGVELFTIKAKTEKAAIKKAVGHWKCHQHAPAFAGIHSADQIAVRLS